MHQAVFSYGSFAALTATDMCAEPHPPPTFVSFMVTGVVEGRSIHETVRITLSRPIKLYDDTPESDYRMAVGYVVAKVQAIHHTAQIGRLRVHPKDWSEDVDELNEGLIPLPDPT